jgi:hypothetical protein
MITKRLPKRFFIMTLLGLLLSGSLAFAAGYSTPEVDDLVPLPLDVTYQLDAFQGLFAIGPVNVKVIRSDRHAIRLIGASEQIAETIIEVNEFQLNITVPEGEVVDAVVYLQNLHVVDWQAYGNLIVDKWNSALLDVTAGGEGVVEFNGSFGLRHLDIGGKTSFAMRGVSSRDMSIRVRNEGVVLLRGMATVSSIELFDKGHLDMYWLDSDELTIDAHNQSTTTIAGVADKMVAVLQGNAQLNARYLRTKEAFVKTYDRALAEIQTISNQNAIAYNESNIYFFLTPDFHANFMARDGSVLNFDGIGQAIRGNQHTVISQVK